METGLDTAIERLFASLAGQALTGLARDQYSFNGEPCSEDAGSLQLQFGTAIVTLKLCGDGQSVTADAKPLQITKPFSLDADSHCSWEFVDMLNTEPWSRLRGQTLRSAEAVVDTWRNDNSSYVSGWFLTFDTNHLCYINWGDNARITFDEPFPMSEHVDFETSRQLLAKV